MPSRRKVKTPTAAMRRTVDWVIMINSGFEPLTGHFFIRPAPH
jgi:hypothetical protein